mmetsp:Transcript_27408/g.49339  ORF Transcript_27408/g.49339 Transcript_27408/m.49339 type:complete len:165 (-) Transcript_27408:58-552(-)
MPADQFRRFMKHPYSTRYFKTKLQTHANSSSIRYESLIKIEKLKMNEPVKARANYSLDMDNVSQADSSFMSFPCSSVTSVDFPHLLNVSPLKSRRESVSKVYSMYEAPHSTINFRYSKLTSERSSVERSIFQPSPPRTRDSSVRRSRPLSASISMSKRVNRKRL